VRLSAAATVARTPRAKAPGRARAKTLPYATYRRRLPCRTAATAHTPGGPNTAGAEGSLAERCALRVGTCPASGRILRDQGLRFGARQHAMNASKSAIPTASESATR